MFHVKHRDGFLILPTDYRALEQLWSDMAYALNPPSFTKISELIH